MGLGAASLVGYRDIEIGWHMIFFSFTALGFGVLIKGDDSQAIGFWVWALEWCVWCMIVNIARVHCGTQ